MIALSRAPAHSLFVYASVRTTTQEWTARSWPTTRGRTWPRGCRRAWWATPPSRHLSRTPTSTGHARLATYLCANRCPTHSVSSPTSLVRAVVLQVYSTVRDLAKLASLFMVGQDERKNVLGIYSSTLREMLTPSFVNDDQVTNPGPMTGHGRFFDSHPRSRPDCGCRPPGAGPRSGPTTHPPPS